jgi:lipid-binding SYLF domain-containing protein
MKWMPKLAVLLCLVVPILAKAADDDTEQARVKASGDVLKELVNGPNGIPLSLLNKSECVIILPSVTKAGFMIAASYGRGVMSCRSGENFSGAWSAPIMM